MHRTLLILGLIMLAAPALAVGKVTIDPNTPGAAVKEDQALKTDTRLSRKVTLSGARKSVRAILDELTTSTGVVFKAGVNNNDWQVRDRKMCVFAKDVPLVQAMNSISHVMKFKWERKGEDGKWTYRLYMDRRTLLDAEAQKLREDERLREKATQKRKAALESYAGIDSLSPDDIANLRDKDPLLYIYADTGIAGSIGQMFREVPALSEAMAGGEPITMTGADMSANARAGLARMVDSVLKFAQQLEPDTGMPDEPIDPESIIIDINGGLARQNEQMMQYIELATLHILFGDSGNINLPLMDPDSAVGRLIGKMLIKCQEGQANIDDIGKQMEADIQNAVISDTKNDYGEPELQHPDDPALKAKVKLTPDGNKLADVQKALADASSYAVISDSFGKTEGSYDFVKDENELGAVLDRLTKINMYNWDKKASILEFRDREWFNKRSAQIPEATLEGWRQTFKKTGTLDIDDLAEIARLDQAQYNMNVWEDEVLFTPVLNNIIMTCRDMLRLYASLTDYQRAAILGDAGLDLKDLSPEQYAMAESVIRTRNAKYLQKPDDLTLRIWRTPSRKRFSYDCQVVTAEELPPMKWEFTTPKYQEPKKPGKPDDKAKPASDAKPVDPAKPGQPAR